VGTRRGERGQALVELALFIPLLTVLTFGAIDLGRVYFAYTALTNAAREGAMCASLGSFCKTTPAAAANAEVNGTLPGGITTAVTGGGSSGSSVTVTVSYNFTLLTTAVLKNTTVPVKASASMVVQ
jgi:Flp pilus assembly protein TadG